LVMRVRLLGWPLRKALLTPSRLEHGSGPLIAAWGERKSILAWSRDPRCNVSPVVLRGRILLGWPAAKAIGTPVRRKKVSAFGEKRTIREWAADPRCLVNYSLLAARLASGVQPEAAI